MKRKSFIGARSRCGAPERHCGSFCTSTIWQSGVIFCLENYDEFEHINCGSGEELSIRELAQIVAAAVGFEGEIVFDASKPDGTPRKLMDSSRIRALGWEPRISLHDGVASAYRWFVENTLPGLVPALKKSEAAMQNGRAMGGVQETGTAEPEF